jgi:hypothetical protein
VSFGRWIAFHQPLTPGLRLIPDGYIELATRAGKAAMFLEVDLGNESLTVWKEKVRNYLQFALSGDCECLFGSSRFRVLVLVNSLRRLFSIRKTVATSTDKIFWFATLESIQSDGLFASLWLRPKGEERLPLVQEPR